jgi:DNA-binding response OmpR family regulator
MQPRTAEAATLSGLSRGVGDAAVTVLVAEDDNDLRELFRTVLSSAGYEVVAVADGVAAREAIQEQPVDLVLTDMWMPKLSGLDLCKRLRSDEATRRLPVLVVSAYGSWRGREEATLAGATDYIAKPVRPSSLLARVESIVGKPPPRPGPSPEAPAGSAPAAA